VGRKGAYKEGEDGGGLAPWAHTDRRPCGGVVFILQGGWKALVFLNTMISLFQVSDQYYGTQ